MLKSQNGMELVLHMEFSMFFLLCYEYSKDWWHISILMSYINFIFLMASVENIMYTILLRLCS